MDKEKFKILTIDYLSDLMDERQSLAFENYMKEHPQFQEQFNELQRAWELMGSLTVPETSERMDEGFYAMLEQQKNKAEKASLHPIRKMVNSLLQSWNPQFAFGVILLAAGLAGGYYLGTDARSEVGSPAIVEYSETEQIREKLVLTLLEQPSASKRLEAVSESTKLNSATEQVIKALFATLNNDPNVNVRIAAIASLEKYVDKPEVRMGFIRSIGNQESPLVQVALADLMVRLQEKSSVNPMRELLEKPDIDTAVKNKLEASINHII